MICYLYSDQLQREGKLSHTMFCHRAEQFKTRLRWDVHVDENGEERDEYDAHNPLYVIWQGSDGGHLGSIRFLPTTGPTMINDHFAELVGGKISSPVIWECTRFCLAPKAGTHVAAGLMLAGGELMRGMGVRQFLGLFDARMVRIYRAIGSSPQIIGSSGKGRDQISVGLWNFTPAAQARVARQARVSPELSEHLYNRYFEQEAA